MNVKYSTISYFLLIVTIVHFHYKNSLGQDSLLAPAEDSVALRAVVALLPLLVAGVAHRVAVHLVPLQQRKHSETQL